MREIEFKFRVRDARDLERLRGAFPGAPARPPARQVNHFFDTPDGALRAARLALRLREQGGRFRLTAKGEASAGGGPLTARPELEAALEPDAARAVLAGERSPLAALRDALGAPGNAAELLGRIADAAGDAPLVHRGSFENERTVLGPVAAAGLDEVRFELDATRFPGGALEHEIEVEVTSDAEAEVARGGLERLLAELGIEWTTAPSKAQRFFEALERT